MISTVAAVQMCSSTSVEDNLWTARQLILEAVSHGAKLIVLPEMFAIMGDQLTTASGMKESYGSGKIQNFLSQLAKENNVWIVGGTIPIESSQKDKITAACLVFDEQGCCVARYNKVHLFDVVLSKKEHYKESDTTDPGNHLTLIDTPFGRIGLGICYDLRFPEFFRLLFNHGVEIIVIPTAFTETTGKAHWEVLARSRAIENFSYVIGACQGGTHENGRKTYGHSLIIDPWGTIVSKKNDMTQGIIYGEIDLNQVNEARKAIPIHDHQRIFFDTLLNVEEI